MSLRSITCTSSLRWCSTTVQPHNTLTIRRSDYSFTVAWTLLFHLNDRFQMFFFPSYYNPPSNYKPTKKTVTKLYKPRACNPDSTVITQNLNLALIFSVIFITLVGLGGPRCVLQQIWTFAQNWYWQYTIILTNLKSLAKEKYSF